MEEFGGSDETERDLSGLISGGYQCPTVELCNLEIKKNVLSNCEKSLVQNSVVAFCMKWNDELEVTDGYCNTGTMFGLLYVFVLLCECVKAK